MKLTRTRTHRFNMGAYEHMEITATVEVEESELDPKFDAYVQINAMLDDMLQEDIDRADETSKTEEKNTHLHALKDVI